MRIGDGIIKTAKIESMFSLKSGTGFSRERFLRCECKYCSLSKSMMKSTHTEDVGRTNAGADLHAMVSKAVLKAFCCGLTRQEIQDVLMAVVCLLPLVHDPG